MYKTVESNDFDAIRLRLASPEQIRTWSHGEVTRPETINYRTQKPEKDGLFCERIFGPSKDWECYCGKYKKIRYKGIICDKCGVEVTRSMVRRERMGHIDLVVPVTHIWFLRGVPSKIGLILDVSVQSLEKVVYFANFIVIEVNEELRKSALEDLRKEFKNKQKEFEVRLASTTGQESSIEEARAALGAEFESAEQELKELRVKQLLTEYRYQELSLKYGHVFEAGIGAEAVQYLLDKIDVPELIAELRTELENASGAKKERVTKRLQLLLSLEANKILPSWMTMTVVPIIPPDLRPMVPLDGGRFATTDLNDLYRRVINRNNRLRRLIELNAPEVIQL